MRIDEAKKYIIANARPLELALFRYFFEGGSKESVVDELTKYQNADGGFGNGLEPDNWNINSNPIAVNDALLTLMRIDALDRNSPVVKGIIRYLDSHDSFDEGKRRWLFAVDSNSRYPHAIWWEKGDGDGIDGFNPTVSLASFMVCYCENAEYYADIVREAFEHLSAAQKLGGDELKCYLLSYALLKSCGIGHVIDMDKTFGVIQAKLYDVICKDTEKYGKEYVAAPSYFFDGRNTEFIDARFLALIDAELQILPERQKPDGGFDIVWIWHNDYEEFEQARAWWRPRITLDRLIFQNTRS